jgi:molecular chaperone IbpA
VADFDPKRTDRIGPLEKPFSETRFFALAIDWLAAGHRGRFRLWVPLLLKRRTDMRSAFDFAPYRRSTIGFDRLFDLLENSSLGQGTENYPPFDLIKVDENHYRINLAVAGFSRDEIDITAQQNQLIVTGKRGDDDGIDYVHRGIANRQFERKFGLADFIKVAEADLKNGLLSVELVREIPEAMRPRKIQIGSTQPKQEAIEVTAKEAVEA